jgi:hypothetical protein
MSDWRCFCGAPRQSREDLGDHLIKAHGYSPRTVGPALSDLEELSRERAEAERTRLASEKSQAEAHAGEAVEGTAGLDGRYGGAAQAPDDEAEGDDDEAENDERGETQAAARSSSVVESHPQGETAMATTTDKGKRRCKTCREVGHRSDRCPSRPAKPAGDGKELDLRPGPIVLRPAGDRKQQTLLPVGGLQAIIRQKIAERDRLQDEIAKLLDPLQPERAKARGKKKA